MYFEGICDRPASQPADRPTVTQRDIGVTLCHAPQDGWMDGVRYVGKGGFGGFSTR